LSMKSTATLRQRIPVIQYHDNWVVCINKPDGITLRRGPGTPRSKPALTTTVKKQLSRKIFPVHRLDHRTSGANLFAFDSKTCGKLHDAAIRKGKKKYVALLRGEWRYPDEYLVDRPLRVQNNITKDAQSKFTLLATTGGQYKRSSLVFCEPLT